MDRHPDGHPAWLDILDPDHVVVPVDSSEEEDPEEDLDGYQTGDDYVPADVPDFGPDEVEVSEPEECVTDEEVISPPSPERPTCPPCVGKGKGPMLGMTSTTSMYTAHRPDLYSFADLPMSDMHRILPDITPYLTRPICGQKRRAIDGPAHYEIGESSQAPPPIVPDAHAQIGALTERIRLLEDHIRSTRGSARTSDRRVLRLEEGAKDDAVSMQTIFHRVSAGRSEARNQQVLIGNLSYDGYLVHNQVDAAERRITILQREYLQLREQFDELVRYMAAHFGR